MAYETTGQDWKAVKPTDTDFAIDSHFVRGRRSRSKPPRALALQAGQKKPAAFAAGEFHFITIKCSLSRN
jgi:hypothetical protein